MYAASLSQLNYDRKSKNLKDNLVAVEKLFPNAYVTYPLFDLVLFQLQSLNSYNFTDINFFSRLELF